MSWLDATVNGDLILLDEFTGLTDITDAPNLEEGTARATKTTLDWALLALLVQDATGFGKGPAAPRAAPPEAGPPAPKVGSAGAGAGGSAGEAGGAAGGGSAGRGGLGGGGGGQACDGLSELAGGRARITDKIARQMGRRGWTQEMIDEAVKSGKQIPAMNKATGNPAIRYIHPNTGQSVVIDTVTNEVIQVGGPGFLHGTGSGDLP